MDWLNKLNALISVAKGLENIHAYGSIHRNFHCGNILVHYWNEFLIGGLRLCQPSSQIDKKQVYGVLPYIAPEVLREKKIIRASDIYGFGIIAYEVLTGMPPYYDIAHDELLALKICQGLRPKSDYKIPQLIFDVIKRCWDANPSNRPNANELCNSLNNLERNLDENNEETVAVKD
ncbi:15721_t:CDS:2 [Funneliformis geosporum]|nr:15721_t:CDS:2 [Funneliformis geosporum]